MLACTRRPRPRQARNSTAASDQGCPGRAGRRRGRHPRCHTLHQAPRDIARVLARTAFRALHPVGAAASGLYRAALVQRRAGRNTRRRRQSCASKAPRRARHRDPAASIRARPAPRCEPRREIELVQQPARRAAPLPRQELGGLRLQRRGRGSGQAPRIGRRAIDRDAIRGPSAGKRSGRLRETQRAVHVEGGILGRRGERDAYPLTACSSASCWPAPGSGGSSRNGDAQAAGEALVRICGQRGAHVGHARVHREQHPRTRGPPPRGEHEASVVLRCPAAPRQQRGLRRRLFLAAAACRAFGSALDRPTSSRRGAWAAGARRAARARRRRGGSIDTHGTALAARARPASQARLRRGAV